MNHIGKIKYSSVLNDSIDQFVVLMDSAGYPLAYVDTANSVLTVDANFDPDGYSVLMAATHAVDAMGFPAEVIESAEVI